ncbi:glycosyltransferase family 25 protein [Campylobacter lari]|uniref:glycosyltransferase family 25 protein n=1 Tax=Campylobacter lari TaxID=201 RepID=UPI0027D46A1D|nr:glycosyltransferase family 25 protein [Campylobacter lari]
MKKIKVFIINLERSKDRKKFMQEQIQKLFTYNPNLKDKLEFEFFKAIDGSKNEHLQFKSHFPWWCQLIRGVKLSTNEKACFASHYSLWIKCQKINRPIIILEDDVEFVNLSSWNQAIQDILHSNYKYVRFFYIDNVSTIKEQGNFYSIYEKCGGGQGYFLHPKAANMLSIKSKYFIDAVDNYMDMYYLHKVQNIAYYHFLVQPNYKLHSTINIRKSKTKIYAKITREIIQLYFQILKYNYQRKKSI